MFQRAKQKKQCKELYFNIEHPRNYDLVHTALVQAGREDLIGIGQRCLIKPKELRPYANRIAGSKNKNSNNRNSSNKPAGKRKEDSRDKSNSQQANKSSNTRKKKRK